MKRPFGFLRRKKNLVRQPLLSEDSAFSLISQEDGGESETATIIQSDDTHSVSSCCEESSANKKPNDVSAEEQRSISSNASTDNSSSSSSSYNDESWRDHGHGLRLNILKEENKFPICESCNPAVPLESYYALCKKVLEAFTNTIRRSSDDSQLLLFIYLEAFVYAHRFQKLHSHAISPHPMFYNQNQKYKCLRMEHISKLNFILSCIEELSERIDLLVYNDTLGTNAAAAVFRILLSRPSPWTEHGQDGRQLQKTPEEDSSVTSTDSVEDKPQEIEESGNGGSTDLFELRDLKLLNLDEEQHDDDEDDRDSEYNAPILRAEFEPYTGEAITNVVPSYPTPEAIQPIREPFNDTPSRIRHVYLSTNNKSDLPSDQQDNSPFSQPFVFPAKEAQDTVVGPPEVKRVDRSFSPGFKSLVHKFEHGDNSLTTELFSERSFCSDTETNASDRFEYNSSPSFEEFIVNHSSPSFEEFTSPSSPTNTIGSPTYDTFTYFSPFAAGMGSTVHQLSPISEESPQKNYRSPTRALRTYRECAETLKVLTHKSPRSVTKSVEPITLSSSSWNSTTDESFEDVSFGNKSQSKTIEMFRAPIALKSSGRYKDLPNYVLED